MALGFVVRTRRLDGWIRRHSKLIAVATVWALILGTGLTITELYARRRQHYVPLSFPMRPASETQKLRVYNANVVERNPGFFRAFGIRVPTFESPSPYPLYLFRKSHRVTQRDGSLVPAKPGEPIFWASNSWGFRGPEFPVEKPAGALRVVCLGASTTEGSQTNDETYPHYLQLELRRRFPDRTIDVLNAGHSGAQGRDLLEILRTRVLPLHPDVVIVYHAANDAIEGEFVEYSLTSPTAAVGRLFSTVYDNSAVFSSIVDGLGWKWTTPHDFDGATVHPSMRSYERELRNIVQEGQRAGATVVLSSFVTLAHEGLRVTHEQNSEVFNELYMKHKPLTPGEIGRIYDVFNRTSRRVADELGAPYVDVAATFPRRLEYFPFDIFHLTPQGNQILARSFADTVAGLVERSSAPSSAPPA